MARGADFDLAKELAKPSFTPAARDAAALVALIAGGEEPAAARAASALAGLGAAGRAAVVAALAAAHAEGPDGIAEGAIARLVGALGLLARAGDGGARAQVIASADHGSPRVRKAAAI